MRVETAFDLFERVKIKELDTIGVIVSVWVSKSGVQYETRYFLNGEAKNVYMFETELDKVKKEIT